MGPLSAFPQAGCEAINTLQAHSWYGFPMITVVSGIPRSGTSLMMQMLSAGGMPVLSDGQRLPDANNPRGYYELESVKSLARDSRIISDAEGKAIKIVSSLLEFLPPGHHYRVVFMRRPLEQIVASQDRMLERLGKQAAAVPRHAVMAAFEKHLKSVEVWLADCSHIAVLYVDYEAVVRDPYQEASRLVTFLERRLDIQAMVRQVEASLHRERSAMAPMADSVSQN